MTLVLKIVIGPSIASNVARRKFFVNTLILGDPIALSKKKCDVITTARRSYTVNPMHDRHGPRHVHDPNELPRYMNVTPPRWVCRRKNNKEKTRQEWGGSHVRDDAGYRRLRMQITADERKTNKKKYTIMPLRQP